jgi:tRNA wybutosine-synthesizing protein 2
MGKSAKDETYCNGEIRGVFLQQHERRYPSMATSKVLFPRKPHGQYTNPLQRAFRSFLNEYISDEDATKESSIDFNALISSVPKRYTLYTPLLLLPPNAFSGTPKWTAFTFQLSAKDLELLYKSIVTAFEPQGITHIALNSPISAMTLQGTSNMTRSPTGLTPLYGDFGPRTLLSRGNDPSSQPSEADFSAAFWAHTTQNGGVFQTWAPLWTMFSRGNISEKARILGDGTFEGLEGPDGLLGQKLGEVAVVDMYVGIGYFALSYLRRGVGRVFGWEVNGWSVEGLRRGCEKNGWGVRVLSVDDAALVKDESGRIGDEALEGLIEELEKDGKVRMIVFRGENRWAASTMAKIEEISATTTRFDKKSSGLNVRHVNLGLLPSSRLSWEDAIDMLDEQRGGWVHVHENVDIREVEQKRDFIVQLFRARLRGGKTAFCSHIKQVKTYAPGVMHCVFDIRIEARKTSRSPIENG